MSKEYRERTAYARRPLSPKTFRRRIERLFTKLGPEQERSPGRYLKAPAWFAERTGYGRSTVYRWLNGTHPIPRVAVLDLEALEAEINGRKK